MLPGRGGRYQRTGTCESDDNAFLDKGMGSLGPMLSWQRVRRTAVCVVLFLIMAPGLLDLSQNVIYNVFFLSGDLERNPCEHVASLHHLAHAWGEYVDHLQDLPGRPRDAMGIAVGGVRQRNRDLLELVGRYCAAIGLDERFLSDHGLDLRHRYGDAIEKALAAFVEHFESPGLNRFFDNLNLAAEVARNLKAQFALEKFKLTFGILAHFQIAEHQRLPRQHSDFASELIRGGHFVIPDNSELYELFAGKDGEGLKLPDGELFLEDRSHSTSHYRSLFSSVGAPQGATNVLGFSLLLGEMTKGGHRCSWFQFEGAGFDQRAGPFAKENLLHDGTTVLYALSIGTQNIGPLLSLRSWFTFGSKLVDRAPGILIPREEPLISESSTTAKAAMV